MTADAAPDLPRRPGGLAPTANRGDFLRAVMGELWPDSGQLQSGRRVRAGQRFALLPRASHPKVAVPLQPRSAAAAVLRHNEDTATGIERLLLRLAATLAPVGFLEYWPGQVGYERSGTQSLAAFLAEMLGQELCIAVYTSEPRSNRKPVIQIISQGQTIGYAKVGVNGLGDELVRAEVQALRELGMAQLRQLTVPKLLYGGQWRGHEVMAQSPLPGSGGVGKEKLAQVMVEVAECGGRTRVDPQDNSYLDGLGSRFAALATARGGKMTAILQTIITSPPSRLDLGAWHGDWTPWNMAVGAEGIVVWDWERYRSGVPVGFDALHYCLQEAIARSGLDPLAAARYLFTRSVELLQPFGVCAANAVAVTQLYLLEIGARYDADRQYLTGSRLGDLDTWLIPALTEPVVMRSRL
jgi:hypothetical protein